MSRKFLFSLLTLAGLTFATVASASEIAVVDFQKVMSESAEMKRATTEVDTMKKAMEKQLETMQKEIESEGESLNRKRSVMTEEQVVEEETALKAKVREYRLKTQNMNEKLNNEFLLRRKQVMTVLQDIVTTLSQERGFKIVVEQGNLLYADPAIDVTDELVKRLNAHYAK